MMVMMMRRIDNDADADIGDDYDDYDDDINYVVAFTIAAADNEKDYGANDTGG
jgi:hypothetical protein